ncbi:MAG: DUF4249 domain-containing protein [Bacteroidota bacterium]
MFKQIISNTLLILAVLLGFGCEEPIELDVDQAPPRYIIDGLITDELTDHYIKISTSTDFYNVDITPKVSGASVIVNDDLDREYIFQESETEPGLYTAQFQGEIGRTYMMQTTMPDGAVFTASDQISAVMSVDSLTWEIDQEEQTEPDEEGLFYDVRIYAHEPAETTDYYLFKFYRNDSLQNFNDNTGLFYADDKLLEGYIYGLEAPTYFRKGDTATFVMHRISRQAYLFYGDLDNALNGDGGMFSPSPVNPRTNLTRETAPGLGFFQTSAVTRESIVVGE